jgi:ABC-type nitrate/sulfonate/bicarbonate transport system ATPase subunit
VEKNCLITGVDLSISYAPNKVLFKNLNFNAFQGDFIAVTGRSGVGKSSFLKVIAGLQSPNVGHLNFKIKKEKGSLPLTMMFQDARLLPWLSISQNISFAIKRIGLSKTEIESRTENILHKLKLEELKNLYPYQSSGGQQQRIALARCIVAKPKIILLDEPCSALDHATKNEIMNLIKETARVQDILVIFVTHELEDVVRYANFEINLDHYDLK